jgi:hypothetical protein
MLTVAYLSKLMKDSEDDKKNESDSVSGGDFEDLIKFLSVYLLLILIIDIVLIWFAINALNRCKNSGMISDSTYWIVIVIILSPLLSILVPVLSILAPFSFITTIGMIIYGSMKCGNDKTPLTFGMWKNMKDKKMKYNAILV